MLSLVYSEHNSTLAARIKSDLVQAGCEVSDTVQHGPDHLALVILSPAALIESSFITRMESALDEHQQIIPIKAEPVNLPRIINNLEPLDFSVGYDFDVLQAQIQALLLPDAPRPLTTLTQARRQANRRAALPLLVMVTIMFVVAVIGVMAGITVPPADEFAGIETQIYLTRNYYIDGALPLNTEQAAEFESTIPHVPTRALVQLLATATAISAGVDASFVPQNTEQAAGFPATLKAVSTVVQDRLQMTVTQFALTAQASTATPAPPMTATSQPEETAEQ